MSFSCDCEGPEFCTESVRRANKPHTCCECKGEIKVGEQHEHVAGKWDGEFSTFRTCERCADLRSSYSGMGYCSTYGSLWADHLDMLLGMHEKQQSLKAIELAKAVIRQRRSSDAKMDT